MSRVSTARRPSAENSLRLSHINWKTYTRLLRVFAEQPGVRLTYDQGELEIMAPLPLHGGDAQALHDLIIILLEELNMPFRRGGSFTIRRHRYQRGLEPDDAFWIANYHRMAGLRRYNPRTDPPPDLVLETDVTHSSLNRLAIYATFGVPEVWRLEGNLLTFYVLASDGNYQTATYSLAFPRITPADLMPSILQARQSADELAINRQFRQWARQLASQGPTP